MFGTLVWRKGVDFQNLSQQFHVSMDKTHCSRHQHYNISTNKIINSSSTSGAHLLAYESGFYLGLFQLKLPKQPESKFYPSTFHIRYRLLLVESMPCKSHSKERRFRQSSWPFGPCSLLLKGLSNHGSQVSQPLQNSILISDILDLPLLSSNSHRQDIPRLLHF